MTKRRRRKQSLFMWCSDRRRDSETSLLLRTLEEEHKELHKLISNLAGKLGEMAVSWKVSDEELDRFENADMVRLEALFSSMSADCKYLWTLYSAEQHKQNAARFSNLKW